jgi:hypothetical protein
MPGKPSAAGMTPIHSPGRPRTRETGRHGAVNGTGMKVQGLRGGKPPCPCSLAVFYRRGEHLEGTRAEHHVERRPQGDDFTINGDF